MHMGVRFVLRIDIKRNTSVITKQFSDRNHPMQVDRPQVRFQGNWIHRYFLWLRKQFINQYTFGMAMLFIAITESIYTLTRGAEYLPIDHNGCQRGYMGHNETKAW